MSLASRYEWANAALDVLWDSGYSTKACMDVVYAAIRGDPMTEQQNDIYIKAISKVGSVPARTRNLYEWWRERYAETGDQEYLNKMLDYVEVETG